MTETSKIPTAEAVTKALDAADFPAKKDEALWAATVGNLDRSKPLKSNSAAERAETVMDPNHDRRRYEEVPRPPLRRSLHPALRRPDP